MVMNGEITESCSVVAILKVANLLRAEPVLAHDT
jgi:hypothetical protein